MPDQEQPPLAVSNPDSAVESEVLLQPQLADLAS